MGYPAHFYMDLSPAGVIKALAAAMEHAVAERNLEHPEDVLYTCESVVESVAYFVQYLPRRSE